MRAAMWLAGVLWAFGGAVRAEGGASAGGLAELRGHGGPVRALAVMADRATLVTGGFDSALIVWDLASGGARRVLRFHGSTVNAVAALPGGCFASGGEDARIAIWCGDNTEPTGVLDGHTAPITQLAVSADGRQLASVSFDRTARVWPLADAGPKGFDGPKVFDGSTGPLNAVAFLVDGTGIVTGGYDGTVRVLSLTAQPAPRPLSLGVPVNAIAVSSDGRLVIAGADGHVRKLARDLTVEADFDVGSGPLTTVALTPDGAIIATAGMRTQVTMIEAATGKTALEILGPGLPVWSLAFSADGRELYTGGQDRAVRRWVTATGKPAGTEQAAVAAQALPFADERGAKLFAACQACHGLNLGDTAKAGPTLAGLFGRKIASAPGYRYSEALKGLNIVWTAETVGKLFTVGPTLYTPGTKMPEQTLSDPGDREALISWLAKVTAR